MTKRKPKSGSDREGGCLSKIIVPKGEMESPAVKKSMYVTIEEEIKSLGIKPIYFDRLYNQLRRDKRLPPGDIIPWKQYISIVDYLRNKQVLGEKNKIQPDEMNIFNRKKYIEKNLEGLVEDAESRYEILGGIAPCADIDEGNSGGIAPCRS